MNAVILWKEYRQQRWILAAIFVLAVMLIVGLGEALGRGSDWHLDDQIWSGQMIVLIGLAVTYGIVSGALLLAGEKEEGTLVFLDGLTGQRSPLWWAKVQAGFLLTLAQGLLLASLALGFGFGSWQTAFFVPIAAMDALACGLLGGALCRNVLLAVMTGVGAMTVNWSVSVLLGSPIAWMIWKLSVAFVEVAVSSRVFCESDRDRRAHALPEGRTKPSADRMLFWLTIRQGRWIMLGLFLGAAILGPMVNQAPLVLYPLATFVVGLICGLAVFAPEQSGRQESFLGSQRLPLGRIWAHKTCFWAMVALAGTILLWGTAILVFMVRQAQNDHGTMDWVGYWFESAMAMFDPLSFMFLWVAHGFCFGVFFGALCRRPIIAAILATLLGLTISELWLPSIVFGGLRFWQYLGLPILLLLASRLAMWPWVSGRLYERRPLLVQAGFCLAAAVWMVGGIGYRVVEIPDVAEPFDIQAYVEGIPPPEKNEAGKLIHEAAANLREHFKKVDAKIPPPTKPAFTDGSVEFTPGQHVQYRYFAGDVAQKGWPKEDAEFSLWLDAMMQGDWAKKTDQAARLPLGVMQDPSKLNINYLMQDEQTAREMASFLTARSVQLQKQGKFVEALEHLETLLGLSRQLMSHAPVLTSIVARAVEGGALTGLERWLQAAGPDVELLKKAQAMLEYHQANMSEPLDPYKAEYFVLLNTNLWDLQPRQANLLQANVLEIAWQIPWESERRSRMARSLIQDQMRLLKTPYWEVSRRNAEAAEIDRAHLRSSRYWQAMFLSLTGRRFEPVGVRGAVLMTALARYQAEQGKSAAKLDDLVPRYLPAVPIDPYSGNPFQYRVWDGKKEYRVWDAKKEPPPAPASGNWQPNWKDARLLDGQTYIWSYGIWSDGENTFRPEYSRYRATGYVFIVPLWKNTK